jgi:hypothetical protein
MSGSEISSIAAVASSLQIILTRPFVQEPTSRLLSLSALKILFNAAKKRMAEDIIERQSETSMGTCLSSIGRKIAYFSNTYS